ncbi:hypothetical protein VTJ04DRAFT_5825 [Mycothermus thermophilus]|uniref:uncharacterized protein n=1 Tax=Humicola insolens TaxID=85995 RepID=UPI003742178D
MAAGERPLSHRAIAVRRRRAKATSSVTIIPENGLITFWSFFTASCADHDAIPPFLRLAELGSICKSGEHTASSFCDPSSPRRSVLRIRVAYTRSSPNRPAPPGGRHVVLMKSSSL